MGYLSCNAESAIATCDSYNWPDLKRRKKKKKKNRSVELKHTPNRALSIREFSYSDLHSATNGFSPDNLLGKGSHGAVYKARLENGRLVAAVKKTKQTEPSSFNTPSENEIEILCRVSNPRLVNLLGYAVNDSGPRERLIVVEYMANGSLYDVLHGAAKPPGWIRRVRFSLQVAKAVQFLHSSNPPVIHRDIKSSNVLIDGEHNARLGDFGLALRGHVEDVRIRSTPPAGTLGYLDPGYLVPADLSSKSDVFSFGILLLEIISGRKAIDVNYSPPSVVDWAIPAIKSGNFSAICDRRIDPLSDEAALRQLAVVAARCVRKSAAKRPGMAEVVDWLKAVYERLNSPIWSSMGRRVRSVREPSRAGKYEPLDDSTETAGISRVGSRRKGRISSVVSSREKISDVAASKGVDPVGRSRSVGSVLEMKFEPLDLSRRKSALVVKMRTVSLRKSRSMGMLQSVRPVKIEKVEESKLLG